MFSIASNNNAISFKEYRRNTSQWAINLHMLQAFRRALLKFLAGLYFESLTQFLWQGKNLRIYISTLSQDTDTAGPEATL